MIKIGDLIGLVMAFFFGAALMCVLLSVLEKESADQCDYAGKTKLNGAVYECHKAQP